METGELKKILENHSDWINEKPSGLRADLQGAYLQGAYLQGVDLRGADLRGADLQGAYLQGVDLRGADLQGVDLRGAYLQGAYLQGVDLRGADLQGVDLRGAYLQGAYLRDAEIQGAYLPWFQIPQEGELIVWKKLHWGAVCKLRIPPEANRTGSLVGRKCRAEFADVLEGQGISAHDRKTVYCQGQRVFPASYCNDIRVECAPGIHFFLTKEEAAAY